MSDLPRNKKLKRVLACLVVAEIDQTLVHDFCPRFRANIAPQIDIKFTGDFEVISGPGIANGVLARGQKRSEGQVFGPVVDERGGVSCLLHRQKVERIKEEETECRPGSMR